MLGVLTTKMNNLLLERTLYRKHSYGVLEKFIEEFYPKVSQTAQQLSDYRTDLPLKAWCLLRAQPVRIKLEATEWFEENDNCYPQTLNEAAENGCCVLCH